MNSNKSMESHTTSMELPSTLLNLTLENQLQLVSPLDHMIPQQIQSHTTLTGEIELNQTLIHSAHPSQHKNEINSVNPSSNLLSHAKPHEILEKLPLEPRVLKVSREDLISLCQVISEFQEQFTGY
jgi:hypothetical protein